MPWKVWTPGKNFPIINIYWFHSRFRLPDNNACREAHSSTGVVCRVSPYMYGLPALDRLNTKSMIVIKTRSNTEGIQAPSLREGFKKKTPIKRSGWPLGSTPPLPPSLPRSDQENVKIFRQVVIFGVILPFYKGQNGSKCSQNRSGQAGGGWPPPLQAVSLTASFPFFFWRLP